MTTPAPSDKEKAEAITNSWMNQGKVKYKQMDIDIAAALAAEREKERKRCAEIAQRTMKEYEDYVEFVHVAETIRNLILAPEILNPSGGEVK